MSWYVKDKTGYFKTNYVVAPPGYIKNSDGKIEKSKPRTKVLEMGHVRDAFQFTCFKEAEKAARLLPNSLIVGEEKKE